MLSTSELRLAVIGLGYVGLPLAVEFAKTRAVVGFDINEHRIAELRAGRDITRELSADELAQGKLLRYSTRPGDIAECNFFIVTVPTPVDDDKQPDLGPVLAASTTIGKALKKGDIVVYESTVYPGATEEDCVPVLERESGLKNGIDFNVGYSPERINPGDQRHRLENVVKVVSTQNGDTLEIVASTYGSVV